MNPSYGSSLVKVSEAQFQKAVIELAHRFNWRVAHFKTAQTSKGAWVTPVAADGAGFPDLCLVRERIVFIELKAEKGTMSDNQLAWGDALRVAGVEYHCFKPRDWDEIERVLLTPRREHLRRITELGQEIENQRGAAA